MAIKRDTTYFVRRKGSSGNYGYLNIYGNSYTGDTQTIKLWEKVPTDNMQKWKFDNTPKTSAYLCTLCDPSRAINVYNASTDPRCTIYRKSNNYMDGLLKIVEHASGYYYIRLVNRELYLTATSTDNGTQVTWGAQNPGSSTQLWEFIEEGSSSSSGGSSTYTGVLSRNTVVSTITGTNPISIKNIPDKNPAFAYNNYIEPRCEFHPSSGLYNEMDFNAELDGAKIKEQLRKYIKIVFGNPNLTMEDKDLCYYLFGERIADGSGNDFHPGVDVNYYEGAPIHPLFPGYITDYNETDYGRVSINVPELNITTTYVHMRDVCDELTERQKSGIEKVYPTDVIGKESGRGATSYDDFDPHLHFEITPYNSSTYAIPIDSPNIPLTSIIPYGYMDGVLNP